MHHLFKTFIRWLPLAVGLIGIAGITYIALQQNYRHALNNPQIEIVENAQQAMLAGRQPVEVVGRGELFDASKILAPFIVVYDESGNVLEANAHIAGKPPRVSEKVLTYARVHGEYRGTWQADQDTRIALVVRPVAIESGWFVASGRNMREGEAHEARLLQLVIWGLVATLVGTLALQIIVRRKK